MQKWRNVSDLQSLFYFPPLCSYSKPHFNGCRVFGVTIPMQLWHCDPRKAIFFSTSWDKASNSKVWDFEAWEVRYKKMILSSHEWLISQVSLSAKACLTKLKCVSESGISNHMQSQKNTPRSHLYTSSWWFQPIFQNIHQFGSSSQAGVSPPPSHELPPPSHELLQIHSLNLTWNLAFKVAHPLHSLLWCLVGWLLGNGKKKNLNDPSQIGCFQK